MDLFLFYLAVNLIITSGLIIYFREHLRKQIGWYLLGMVAFMVVTNWDEYWWMLFFSFVVFLKTPPFSIEDKLMDKASRSDNKVKRWSGRQHWTVKTVLYIMACGIMSALITWLKNDGYFHFFFFG